MENKKVALAYIPVLHQGYLTFLKDLENKGVEELYLVSDDILESHEEFDYINRKDRLRAVPHDVMKQVLTECTSLTIQSLTTASIFQIHEERAHIYTPHEDISRLIIEMYFGGHIIHYQNVFLRWNRDNVGEEQEPKGVVTSLSEFQKRVFSQVIEESEKSADWWRTVGAALVKNGELIALTHNEHMPEEELPNLLGDTRALFKKGMNVNYVTAAHAEVGAIGEAAKKGISTHNAELFVTDFPCPYCARLIAKAGIKKVYFLKGYAVLGGDEFFKEMGIEVLHVVLE